MDFLLIAYILIAIVLILGLFFVNFSARKPILAIISSLGVLAAAIVFGLRWFPGGTFSLTAATVVKGGPWPPSVNLCPDYLTYLKVGGTAYCVDPIGVSRRNGTDVGMAKFMPEDSANPNPNKLFNLHASKTGDERVSALVAECKAKGVVWEGIYNGSVPMGGTPPSLP